MPRYRLRKLGPRKVETRPRKPGGGAPRGGRNGSAKLTMDQVAAIRWEWANRKDPAMRWLKVTQVSLAERYGVTQGTIQNVVTWKTWAHVPGVHPGHRR